MADIDLKTETPDTSINDSAVLFGADSQASASPSVYAVSTLRGHIVSTANTFTALQTLNRSGEQLALGSAGANSGVMSFAGSTSGKVTVQAAAAAGTYTLTLPVNDGESGQFLQTDGSGVTSWATASGGSGSPGGSTTQIQYNNAGSFGGMSGTAWDDTNRALTITGATVTADAPILNLSQTWSNSGVTFTGIKLNITNTASGGNSLLQDWQIGGVSYAKLATSGTLTTVNISTGSVNASTVTSSGNIWINSNTAPYFLGTSADLILSRRGAANLRLGAADAAAPVAQTLSVQSVVAGTTNTAGTNLTITGSQGTGTGAGGSIIFQVAPAGSSGSAQNALATALTIASSRTITHSLNTTDYTSHVPAGQISGYLNALGRGTAIIFDDGSGNGTGAAFWLGANGVVKWQSVNRTDSGTTDLILARDAANTLALRNGTAAQTLHLYKTFTDASNYARLVFDLGVGDAASLAIRGQAAGSGTFTNIDIGFSNTKLLRFDASNATLYGLPLLFGTDNTVDIGASAASRPRNIFIGSYAQMSEMTAPAAPAANGVRIYAVDNGSGKTQLMALFATGAAQQIAIEP